MNEQERKSREAQLLATEMLKPVRWWYLSFAENGFLGATCVEAHGILTAVQIAWERGINPGGQVAAMPCPETLEVPAAIRYTLVTDAATVEQLFK